MLLYSKARYNDNCTLLKGQCSLTAKEILEYVNYEISFKRVVSLYDIRNAIRFLKLQGLVTVKHSKITMINYTNMCDPNKRLEQQMLIGAIV